MNEFWSEALEWGLAIVAMAVVFRLGDLYKERRQKRRDAEAQAEFAEWVKSRSKEHE